MNLLDADTEIIPTWELPLGFKSATQRCGIKKNGDRDLVILTSDVLAQAAAVFTQNSVQAAPVLVSKQHLSACSGKMRGLVINSGNANAVTGEQGRQDALRMTECVATLVGCEKEQILVMSTGVIGQKLPMDKVTIGISDAVPNLSRKGAGEAILGIMTTDTKPKYFQKRVFNESTGESYLISGMAKGAGMIHPNMATMLGVILTDALVSSDDLQNLLKKITPESFNAITIDGDTSTNDTVAIFANGAAGFAPNMDEFESALREACCNLAQQIIMDAEGATKFIILDVQGLDTHNDAMKVAKTIATSVLFKTAMYGRDANWGRVLAAAGRSGIAFEITEATLLMGDLCLLKNGMPEDFSEESALDILSKPEVHLSLQLGQGPGSARVWTSDLTHEYISVNASYRS
jgi:glutamate N-acetyltransferase/amino-acid N-acetyltransferase